MRRTVPTLAILALAIPALPACGGDGTTAEPELEGLEPLVVADSVDALVDPLMAAREVSTNFRMALEDLREAGVQFRRVGTGGPAAVTFPPGFLGRVFRYESVSGSWVVDETRTGAPADGVRVIWYQLDGSQVELPAHELGHIDLTDGDEPALEQLHIRGVEVRTGADNVALLDFVQGYAMDGGIQTFEAAGSYSDGLRDVEFALDLEETAGGSAQEYSVVVTLEDGPVSYEFRSEGTGSVQGAGFDDAMRATVEIGSDRTVLEIEISGVGPQREAAGTITFNGTLLARVAADGTLYTFTDPDDNPYSATASSELNIMVRTLLLSGLEPFTWLPLELP